MELTSSGVTFTSDEVESMATRLHQVVRVTGDAEAARLTALLYSVASAVASLLTAEQEDFRVSTLDYASLHEMSARTVRYQCLKGLLPAIKDESGHWRIKVAA